MSLVCKILGTLNFIIFCFPAHFSLSCSNVKKGTYFRMVLLTLFYKLCRIILGKLKNVSKAHVEVEIDIMGKQTKPPPPSPVKK